MSHVPRYIRYPTGDVTSYIHTCDVSHISLIYIIYITYVPIHRPHYIQHYTNRLKYSASNIPTFSRRESSLPDLVHPFLLSPPVSSMKSLYDTSIIIILHITYLTPTTYLYNMIACLLLSHEIISLQIFPVPHPSASGRSIMSSFFFLFFPPFFLVSENPESQCREECSRLAAIATTANADFREHNASSTHCACSATPAAQPCDSCVPSPSPSLHLRGIVLFVKSICIAPRFSQRH